MNVRTRAARGAAAAAVGLAVLPAAPADAAATPALAGHLPAFVLGAASGLALAAILVRSTRSRATGTRAPREDAASADELRSVLDAAPAAIWIAHDAECRVVTGSRTAHEMLRVPRGANLSKTAPGDDAPRNFRVLDADGREFASHELPLQRTAASGVPIRGFREQLLFDDGTRRVLYGNVEPLRDAAGRPAGAVGAFVDITDLVAAEARIREGAQRLAAAAGIARLGLWEFDPEMREVLTDARCREVLGLADARPRRAEELERLLHEEDREAVARAFDRALERDGEGRIEVHCRIVRPDGGVRWVMMHAHRTGDAHAGARLVGTLMDVTEREQAQQTIERQREELQTLFDVLPVGVVIAHDRTADRVTVTPGFAALLGVSAGEPIALTAAERAGIRFRYPDGGGEVPLAELPLNVAVHSGREVRERHLDVARADGRTLHLMVNAAPVRDARGEVRGGVAAVVDVTALRTHQRALEAAGRQKDEFLATLAHELRNPMAPIRYAAAMLREDASPGALERARRMIERQSALMARLLDDLLDVSRITRNVVELKREPVDLRAIVAEAIEGVRPDLEARTHRLEQSLPGEPAWVDGDPARLLQVVGNLLGNAAKYTPAGGRIAVDVDGRDGRVELRIADTGIGLAPEMLPRVFDLFAQVHREHAASQGGLGIGLAVVRKLVELHGGRIEARSEGLGRGAEFVVSLPRLRQAPAATAGGANVAELHHARPRVLVVDDNRDAAEALAMLLRLHGAPAHVAHGGEEALELADAVRPAVVVLDLGLPTMSGEEVARALRTRPWGRDLRIIAVTGWGQAEDRERTRGAGFDLHLVKPVDPEELLAAALQPPTGERDLAS